jgi:hypothetical protein
MEEFSEIHKKMSKQENTKSYVWVKDESGNEFLCPIAALKNIEDATEEELKNCVDVEALRPLLDSSF